jgi:hypothetical protein
MITVCAFALEVNAEETEMLVLLIMLFTVRIIPSIAILEPTVKIPNVFETLNLVFVPITKIEAFATFTVPEMVLPEIVETLIVLALNEDVLFKSA